MATATDPKVRRHPSVLDAVRALTPKICARAPEIEAVRRLPRDLIRDLTAAGCFRMLVPRSHGGEGFDLASAMHVIEELSRADASTAWTTMNLAGGWINLGGLPRATFDALYARGARRHHRRCLRSFRNGRARERRPPGERLVGVRQRLFGNCMEDSGDGPRLRTALFSPGQIKIEDTWSISGLCGTGSHHLNADDVFVPAERTCLPFADPPCVDEPMLRIPMPPVFAFGAADAQLRAARGLLYADAAAAWGTAVAGAAFTPEHRVRMRAATTWAATTAASVVDMAYHAGGWQRDLLSQHFLVKLDTLTTAGAVRAGAEAGLTVF